MRARDVLIVMTRLPREGRNKTRLIPALGPRGASAFHDRLARHAVGRASSYTMMHPGTRLEIQLEGGTNREGEAWLGTADFQVQADGDLGKRMRSAIDFAFSDGARRVVVIGTDCPSIDEAVLESAFRSLDDSDLVYGPAADGGYYLIGLSSPCPAVFDHIEWGSHQVLDQSLAAARHAGVRTTLLGMLGDVDLPEDLPAAELALAAGASLSVVIPTLNEELHLPFLLEQLKPCAPHEIIVADGGSDDRTEEIARHAGVKFMSVPRGRASQMNRAAAMATGEFLLFLHADTMPPPGFQRVITRILQSPATSAGAFRFELAEDSPAASLIESLVDLRCRWLGTPYGDQGLFMRRRIFQHLGAYPEWPAMEDLHLVRRLKRLGTVRIAPEAARTSARRWTGRGTIRTCISHQLMLAAYHLGASPAFIARLRP